ncbi:MAG: CoA-binding protein, partial [Dehalococcoidales bacterium]
MPEANHTIEPSLEYLFNPKNVAVVGVSSNFARVGPGRMYVEALITAGYKGNIYPISRSGDEIFGLKVYPGLKDIPGSVDYVIAAIPAFDTP